MSTIEIIVPGEPETQGSKNIGRHGQIYERTSKTLNAYRQNIAIAATKAAKEKGITLPINQPVAVSVTFVVPKPKKPKFDQPATPKDLDKMVRAVFDGLAPKTPKQLRGNKAATAAWAKNNKTLFDDSRITRLTAQKVYPVGNENPHTEIGITI